MPSPFVLVFLTFLLPATIVAAAASAAQLLLKTLKGNNLPSRAHQPRTCSFPPCSSSPPVSSFVLVNFSSLAPIERAVIAVQQSPDGRQTAAGRSRMRPRCLPPPPCLVLLLLIPFLISRVPESACLLQEYEDCRDPSLFQCGEEEFNVSYPFLAADRKGHCGIGEHYALSCVDGGTPVIDIGGRPYRVRRIDYAAGVLGVADLAASRNRTCPLASYENATLDWSLFEYTGDDLNITLYGNCTTPVSSDILIPNLYEVPCLARPDKRSYVVNPEAPPTDPFAIDSLRSSCLSTAVVPLGGTAARSLNLSDAGSLQRAMEEGFNLTWTSGNNSWCRDCISSGGACGFNSSAGTQVCFCSDNNASARYCSSSSAKGNNKRRKTAIGVGVGVVGFLLAGVLCFLLSRNMRARTGPSCTLPLFRTTTSSGPPSQKGLCFKFSNDHKVSAVNDVSADQVPFLDFESVKAATSNFSDENKLGEGGFGPVYKGKLSGGDEVAVKRLSKLSKQGHQEFSNEVRLAKLQHKNLIRLLGSCAHQDEKLLIYEYMPNKSLDKFIFDPRRSAELSWQKRFGIIEGIANGLLYLHHNSRMRIIHRDLKTGNILLDSEMNPKITDFVLARIFGAEQMEANTRKVVGTFGYISPEYALHGLFSEKSDVFSFGVILLEIITGERSTSFYPHKNSQTLLGYVWRMWEEGRALELLDPSMGSSPSQAAAGEVLKCIQLGLLCVQQDAAARPTMSHVVLSLSSGETCVLPNPGQPAFANIGRDPNPVPSASHHRASVNGLTLSSIGGR